MEIFSEQRYVADQTGKVQGRIKRLEISLMPGFYMIVTEIVSMCRQLIRGMSPMCRSRSMAVTIIWKPGFTVNGHLFLNGCFSCAARISSAGE